MAFDGEEDGSPLAQALISWWKNPGLSTLQIHHLEVNTHVHRKATSLAPAGAQCPEWTVSGIVNFCFLKKSSLPQNPPPEAGPPLSGANSMGRKKQEDEKDLWEMHRRIGLRAQRLAMETSCRMERVAVSWETIYL